MSGKKTSDIGTDITLVGADHAKRYLETDGAEGYIWNGVPILLFTTKGRKSGEARVNPIIYAEDGETIVIIASRGGSPAHPAWYLNIQADPHVKVQIKGEKFDTIARTAQGEERERLWALSAEAWPNYNVYQSRTDRQIPVVVLERQPA
jgi:deazaflavin-dependent oxidoreductase (nitroreductase family)